MYAILLVMLVLGVMGEVCLAAMTRDALTDQVQSLNDIVTLLTTDLTKERAKTTRLEKQLTELRGLIIGMRSSQQFELDQKAGVQQTGLYECSLKELRRSMEADKAHARETAKIVETLKEDLGLQSCGLTSVRESLHQLINNHTDLRSDFMDMKANLSLLTSVCNTSHREQISGNKDCPSCSPGFIGYKNSCYLFEIIETEVGFEKAQNKCSNLGASLVAVETLGEQDFIISQLPNVTAFRNVWLTSGRSKSDHWIWESTNQSVSFSTLQVDKDLSGYDWCLVYRWPWNGERFELDSDECGWYGYNHFICEKDLS